VKFSTLLFDRPQAPAPTWVKVGLSLIGFLILSAVCWAFLAGSTKNWQAVWEYRLVFWKGWLMTVGLSAVALVLSLIIGTAAALARRSTFLPLRGAATLYVELVRGMPLLALLLFFYYVVADPLGWQDRLSAGVFALSLFSGAYIAEIVRAGIGSVGASQRESARAIGLTPFQTYRFIVFPQALRHSLPPLAGQFASIIKDSSLLSILGIGEFTMAAQQINSATFSTLESFLPLAVGYLILTIPVSLGARYLEHRLRFET
jgi:polar amino acid transport system permease protein